MEPPIVSSPDQQLGRILIEWGMVSENALRECIELQRKMESDHAAYIPRLGELLVERGYATADQILEALAAQNRKILFCAKCGVNVNVDVRPDVMSYRCGKCEGELTEPPQNNDLKVVESTIMFVIRDPLPPEVQESLQNAASKFGKYVIIQEIGRGGIGVVYKAWDTYLGQYVALKRLKPDTGDTKKQAVREGQIQSLLKEARSAVRLRHPHIATVYDIGRVANDFYISLEYLEGRTLAADLTEARTKGKISPFFDAPKRYLRYVRDVARALHYAHTRPSPVVHCDMKPSNVFIDKNDRAYILDFGLARNLRALSDDAAPGTISGTPSYMAPEQASGHPEDIDARTDVYGVGAILYELLTGRPPFIGSLQSVLRKSISELPDRPTEVVTMRGGSESTRLLSRVPPELEDLCLRCLQKEPSMRFQTAHEMANALDRIIKGDTSTQRIAPTDLPTPMPMPAPKISDPLATGSSPAVRQETPAPMPAPPAAPAARSIAPPKERPGYKIGIFLAGVATAALLFGAVALLWSLVAKKPSEAGSRPLQRIVEDAASFRPDRALLECRDALRRARDPREQAELEELEKELRWIEEARKRAIEGIARMKFDRFRFRDRVVENLELLKATETKLVVFAEEQSSTPLWEEVAPEQILELARLAIKEPTPEDTLGLALFARRAGLKAEANQMLESLRQTPLQDVAERYLR